MKRVIHVGCYFFILLWLALASLTSTYCESSFFSSTGIWSVLPPLIAIALAFLMRNVIVSLLTGVFSAAYLLALQSHGSLESIPHCFLTATEQMWTAVAEPWNAGVLLQCAMIGGLVGLITRSGCIRAVAEFLAKFVREPVSSQIVSWFLGFLIFFDDYANIQIRGPIMRPLMDRSGTSREKIYVHSRFYGGADREERADFIVDWNGDFLYTLGACGCRNRKYLGVHALCRVDSLSFL